MRQLSNEQVCIEAGKIINQLKDQEELDCPSSIAVLVAGIIAIHKSATIDSSRSGCIEYVVSLIELMYPDIGSVLRPKEVFDNNVGHA